VISDKVGFEQIASSRWRPNNRRSRSYSSRWCSSRRFLRDGGGGEGDVGEGGVGEGGGVRRRLAQDV
jgi:hypothetical protein